MDRLIATGSVPLSGADTAPASGTPQYATDGIPGVSAPTQWPAYQYNALQEEILAVITAAALAPDRTILSQMVNALSRRFSGGLLTPVAVTTTLTIDDAGLVLFNASGGSVTATLPPAASGAGSIAGNPASFPLRFTFSRIDATANTAMVVPAAGDQIVALQGVSTGFLVGQYHQWQLVSDAAHTWYAVALGSPLPGSLFLTAAGAATWVCPPGVLSARVRAWGAGAGGGFSGSTTAPSGGGGGGGYFEGVLPFVPGTTYSMTVGVGGVGGSSGATTGGTPAYDTAVSCANGAVQFIGSATGGSSSGEGQPGRPPTLVGLTNSGQFLTAGGITGGPPNNTGLVPGAGGASFGSPSQAPAPGQYIIGGAFVGCGGNGVLNAAGGAGANGGIFITW